MNHDKTDKTEGSSESNPHIRQENVPKSYAGAEMDCGMSIEDILHHFPTLTREQIQEVRGSDETDKTAPTEPIKSKWDHYGLPVYRINGVDYAVADTDEDADKAARDYIEGALRVDGRGPLLEPLRRGGARR